MPNYPKKGNGPRDVYVSNVPADVLEWVRQFATEDRRSLTAEIITILSEYVEQRRKQQPPKE